MSGEMPEAEVSGIEYVGPHPLRPDIYEIVMTLAGTTATPRTRLSLLFRPTEATLLAQMLRWNPPSVKTEDHVLTDIAHLQT